MSLEQQLEILERYLEAKRAIRDWHGVRDVCVDIEILEARIKERADRSSLTAGKNT